jgi:hypothetical protein
MSSWMIYWWLYSVCFLYMFGTMFAFTTNDPEFKSKKYPSKQHYFGNVLWAGFCSMFLVLGAWFIWEVTERAKYGWSVRMPE